MAKTKQKNSEAIKKYDINTENNVNIQGNVKLSIKNLDLFYGDNHGLFHMPFHIGISDC